MSYPIQPRCRRCKTFISFYKPWIDPPDYCDPCNEELKEEEESKVAKEKEEAMCKSVDDAWERFKS